MLNFPQKPANKGAPARDKRKDAEDIATNGESLYNPLRSLMVNSSFTLGSEFKHMNRPTFEKI